MGYSTKSNYVQEFQRSLKEFEKNMEKRKANLNALFDKLIYGTESEQGLGERISYHLMDPVYEKINASSKTGLLFRRINNIELDFIKEIFGNIGLQAVKKSTIFKLPANINAEGAAWNLSFKGLIWVKENIYNNSLQSADDRDTFIHEVFHQIQYYLTPGITNIPNPVQGTGAFDNLINEQLIYDEHEKRGIDVYNYNNLKNYNKLSDLPFLESQAKMVGNFAGLYYRARYGSGIIADEKETARKMAELLRASNYNSEAIRWVLQNL